MLSVGVTEEKKSQARGAFWRAEHRAVLEGLECGNPVYIQRFACLKVCLETACLL